MRTPHPGSLLLPLLLAAAGCSSSSSASAQAKDAGGAGDASVANPDGATDGGADGRADSGPFCAQGCQGGPVTGALCVVTANAALVTTSGAPAEGNFLLLCGTNLCSAPTKTDSTGKAQFDLCVNMKSPALKYLGGTSYASFAVAMTEGTETFPPITLVPLPEAGAPYPVDAGGTVTSGPVTLTIAPGAVTFDTSQPTDTNSVAFRATPITPAEAPPGLAVLDAGVKALWGLAPANALIVPSGVLSIPNPDTTAWPAGTKVTFYLNSLDENADAAVPYGQWGPIGRGTVSADGTTITTDAVDAGGGLPLTGIVAVGP